MTAQQSVDAGIDTVVLVASHERYDRGELRRAQCAGSAQLVTDRAREVVVGATFTGADVADLLHAATIAVVGELPIDRLREALRSRLAASSG